MKKPPDPILLDIIGRVSIDTAHGALVEILKWSTDQLDTYRWTVRVLSAYNRDAEHPYWTTSGPYPSASLAATFAGERCGRSYGPQGYPGALLLRQPIRGAA